MTFRRLTGQSDDLTHPGSPRQPAGPAHSAAERSFVTSEQLQLSEEAEEYEMMLAGLEDFDLAEIAVQDAMAEFILG